MWSGLSLLESSFCTLPASRRILLAHYNFLPHWSTFFMAIKITWLSHSGFHLDIDGTSVLVDPFLTDNPLASINPDDLSADYILLTHGHGDHVGDTVSIATRTNAMVI